MVDMEAKEARTNFHKRQSDMSTVTVTITEIASEPLSLPEVSPWFRRPLHQVQNVFSWWAKVWLRLLDVSIWLLLAVIPMGAGIAAIAYVLLPTCYRHCPRWSTPVTRSS